jgi:hypothetical protein
MGEKSVTHTHTHKSRKDKIQMVNLDVNRRKLNKT